MPGVSDRSISELFAFVHGIFLVFHGIFNYLVHDIHGTWVFSVFFSPVISLLDNIIKGESCESARGNSSSQMQDLQ